MLKRIPVLSVAFLALFALRAPAAEGEGEGEAAPEAAAPEAAAPEAAAPAGDPVFDRLIAEGAKLLNQAQATLRAAGDKASEAAKKAVSAPQDATKEQRAAVAKAAAALYGEAAGIYRKAAGEYTQTAAKYEELGKHVGPERARFATTRTAEARQRATVAEANGLFQDATIKRDAGEFDEATRLYGEVLAKLKPVVPLLAEGEKAQKKPYEVAEETFLILRAEGLVKAMAVKKGEETKRTTVLAAIKANEAEMAKERSIEVDYGGKTHTVKVPRTAGAVLGGGKEFKDLYAVDPAEEASDLIFLHYDEWTLKTEDFTFQTPFTISFGNTAGADSFFFVLPFAIKNSTGKKREIAPLFRIRTSDGWSTTEIGAYLPHRALEERTLREYLWATDFYLLPGQAEAFEKKIHGVREPVKPGLFEPDEIKHGVAVFRRLDPNMDAMVVLVEGLASDHGVERSLRKALMLPFVRKGDEFDVDLQKVDFKRVIGDELLDPIPGYLPNRDRHVLRGYDWVWIWEWERELTLEAPTRTEIERPGVKEQRAYWHYEYRFSNRTETEAERRRRPEEEEVPVAPFELRRVNTLLPLEIMGHKVIVRFPDDGSTDVYRTRLAEGLGYGSRATKRFLTGGIRKGTPERPSSKTGLVVFAEEGYDELDVVQQIEDRLELGERLKAAKKAAGREKAVQLAGVVRLTAKQRAQVTKELKEKVPAALAEAMKVKVPGETRYLAAEITAEAGLSSASKALVVSYWPRPVKLPKDIRTGE